MICNTCKNYSKGVCIKHVAPQTKHECGVYETTVHEIYHVSEHNKYTGQVENLIVEAYEYDLNKSICVYNIYENGFIQESVVGGKVCEEEAHKQVRKYLRRKRKNVRFSELISRLNKLEPEDVELFFQAFKDDSAMMKLINSKPNRYIRIAKKYQNM